MIDTVEQSPKADTIAKGIPPAKPDPAPAKPEKPEQTPKQMIEAMMVQARKDKRAVMQVVTIDSALGEELLRRNTNNRDLSRTWTNKIRSDIAADRWMLNYFPIIVSSDGVLADGQKRSSAVVGTDLSFQSLLVVGADPAARATMDMTQPRSAGDFLKMQGEEHGAVEAAITRLLLAYNATDGKGLKQTSAPTSGEVLAYFDDHKADIRAAADLALQFREVARYHVAPSMLGFVYLVTKAIDPAMADTYIRQIAKGEGLKEDDPAYAVRTRLLAMGRVGSSRKAKALLEGWTAFRKGRAVKKLHLTGQLPLLN